MHGGNDFSNWLVECINRVFEEEGIGYELTKFTVAGKSVRPPQINRKDEQTVYEIAVKPALEVLQDPRFATANGELLDAFKEIRSGKHAGAITNCGQAFESVLKTICSIKGWPINGAHGCADLINICKDGGIFFAFYATMFAAIGTVRNKIGDAHGKGPVPEFTAEREHAEHMIALTCSHITFIVRQAKI